MKRVVVLLIGIIIGILAGMFFVQSLSNKSAGNKTNTFRKLKTAVFSWQVPPLQSRLT